jgi:hypothetical protein
MSQESTYGDVMEIYPPVNSQDDMENRGVDL